MLKSKLLLLVLLLGTSSPPDQSRTQQHTGAPATEATTFGKGASCTSCAHLHRSPHLRSRQPLFEHNWHQHHGTWTPSQWLRPGVSRGSSFGHSSSNGGYWIFKCSSAVSSRFMGASRGWGIRVATASLVDAGGVNVDGSGLRGDRQAASGISRSASASAAAEKERPNSASGGGNASSGTGAADGASNVCSDSCHLARNGICEDGSNIIKLARDGGVQVACDFGTDCTDCGPYRGIVSTWGTEGGFKGPIDFLRRQGVKVYARRVTFEPRFLFAYTDPAVDLDVSEQIERAGCMELGIVQVFRHVLSERCAPFKVQTASSEAQGSPPLVVDVGANFGYFALYAAMLGCRVVAVEPIPRFLAFLHWNMAANGIKVTTQAWAGPGPGLSASPGVIVVERVVSTISSQNISMAAPRKGVWGTASVAGMANNVDQDLEILTVGSTHLDEIVGAEQVLLLKVDVEGYEPVVFQSGQRLISEGRLENILMEYSPGMPETLQRFFPTVGTKTPITVEDPPKMLLEIMNKGFTIVQLPDNFAKSGYSPQLLDPIPEFQEVTARSVMYDLVDAAWFQNISASGSKCPWPPELQLANAAVWGEGCLKAPEDSHPKGFRVTHSYNTNLWASRNRSSFKISGPVGLFAPEQDETKSWWSQRYPDKGVGNRACAFLPAGQLLRSRCRCSKPDVCGREEEALLKALATGQMPRPPAPPRM
ncbi:hypothetical protein VaNZ11_012658 [Volvox africanus]|uniref:Methyltransferase FkbM domain-containing protein n=1 Tax=Volvox africanus TaxID=51714 RepID=A0ABQ5SEE5_9CHLO|nr:hypothetical protein VaNZ11_012658 [Volvox africanus]